LKQYDFICKPIETYLRSTKELVIQNNQKPKTYKNGTKPKGLKT
jgi:hypothetical protein